MSHFKRFSLAPIVLRHYAALRKPGSRWIPVGTCAVLFVIPLAAGVIVGLFAFQIQASTLTPALAAVGVLTGAFLAGFVLLTNLRLKMRDDENLSYRVNLTRLVGETAVTALYLVTTCLAAIAWGLVAVVVGSAVSISVPVVAQLGVGLFAAVLTHIGVTALTLLRRVFSVYEQLFRSDFVPQLRVIPLKDNEARNSS
jgi:hypothetical protein